MERDKFLMKRRWVIAIEEGCDSDKDQLMAYEAIAQYAFDEIIPREPKWLRFLILAIKEEIDESIYDLCSPQRASSEYKDFRKKVLERDGYTCQMCGATEQLHVHHIKSFAKYKKDRTNPDNGITLCANCHRKVHSKHGDL